MSNSMLEPNIEDEQPKKAKKQPKKEVKNLPPNTKFIDSISTQILNSIGKIKNFYKISVILLFESQNVGRYRCNVMIAEDDKIVKKISIVKSYFVYCNHNTGKITETNPKLGE